jgi:hypothetical protein
MSVQIVEAKIKAESVTDVQAAAKKMFAALNAAQPEGIRYAWYALPDGETFAALVQVDDGVENPLPGLPEFQELQEVVGGSLAEPPNSQPVTVVGSYRFF